MRETNWANGALGPVDRWPAPLRTGIEIMLGIRFPSLVWWGPPLFRFHNDATLALDVADAPGSAADPIWPEEADVVRRVLRSGEPLTCPASVGRRGDERLEVSLGPLRADDGSVAGVFAVARPAGVEHRLDEAQRNIRGTLAILRSIARRTAATSRSVAAFSEHLDGRIAAISRVQVALMRQPFLGVSLEMLVADTMAAAGARETREFTLAGPEVILKGKRAETMGLALHELATNAIKFGALSRRDARIAIRWRTEPGGEGLRLIFVWEETGAAPPNGHRPAGFGVELLDRMLPYELDATVSRDFARDGFRCRIELLLLDGEVRGERA